MNETKLDDLEIYKIAVELSRIAWKVFVILPYPHKGHIGCQFLDAIDSVGANIAEGFGRYHYKDSLKFYYYSRGSLFESKHWLYVLKTRDLINSDIYEIMLKSLINESVKLNNFINSIKNKIKS